MSSAFFFFRQQNSTVDPQHKFTLAKKLAACIILMKSTLLYTTKNHIHFFAKSCCMPERSAKKSGAKVAEKMIMNLNHTPFRRWVHHKKQEDKKLFLNFVNATWDEEKKESDLPPGVSSPSLFWQSCHGAILCWQFPKMVIINNLHQNCYEGAKKNTGRTRQSQTETVKYVGQSLFSSKSPFLHDNEPLFSWKNWFLLALE